MMRDDAVKRINDALGFRPVGHSLTDVIIARLIEAQRDLEHGKTLPKFLLVEDEDLILPAGAHSVPLPTAFLRIDDDNLPHHVVPPLTSPIFLQQMRYSDAVKRIAFGGGGTASDFLRNSPRFFVIRKATIDFVVVASTTFTFKWNYYKGAMTLESNVTNFWLNEATGAPEWLIGEAGYRTAMDLRDKDAMGIFDDLRNRGRASYLAHQFAEEESGGPFVMGANN
jgi:hypothetical protein